METNGVTTQTATAISNPAERSDNTGFSMPDKFAGKSAEEIAKSYTDLESFTGSLQTKLTAIEEKLNNYLPSDAPAPEGVAPTPEPTAPSPTDAATAWNDLLTASPSTVTDEQLSQLNLPREVYDKQVQMAQENYTLKAALIVGGEENLQKTMNSEYVQKLSPTQRQIVEAGLDNPETMEETLLELAKQAGVTAGTPTQTSTGLSLAAVPQRSTTPSVQPFANAGEWAAAKRDPRYGKDAQYTQMTEQRAAAMYEARRNG